MPYSGVSDPNLPEHIASLPEDQRRVWTGAVNGVLQDCEGEDCEGRAFAVANAAIKAMQATPEELPEMVTERMLGGEIKALGNYTIGGYGVLFTNEDDTDLEQDFFTPDTYFWEENIPTKIVLYDHAKGLHPDMVDPVSGAIDEHKSVEPQRYILGTVTKRVRDQYGIWFEGVLDENDQWRDYVMELVNQGRLNYSTDSIAHLVDRQKVAGKRAYWIKSWPLPAISLTHAAAEPRALVRAVKRASDRALAEAARPQPGELEASKQAPKIRGDQPMSTKRLKKTGRLARAFFDAHEDQILNDHVKSLFWKARAYKQDDAIVEEVATEGELDKVIKPVADQLASLIGCDPGEAVDVIKSLIAERMAPADATKQDELLDEELPDSTKEGFAEDDEFAMKQDGLEDDEFMKQFEGEDEFMKQFEDEDEFMKMLDEDEQVPYQTPALKSVKLDPDLMFAHLDVNDQMSGRRGASFYSDPVPYATKRVNVNRGVKKHEHGLLRLVKAMDRGDHQYLTARRKPVYNGYVKHRGGDWATKALGTTPDTLGGYLVPIEQANEIIGNLYDESVLFSGNLVTKRNMASAELNIPRATQAITVGHVGENTQLTDADITFGVETLRARKAFALIRISREELEDSDPDVEDFYTSEIATALAEFVDQQTLLGAGTAAAPLGLLNRTGVVKTALNLSPTYADLVNLVSRIEQAKIKFDNTTAWIMNPRETATIRQLEDTAGNLIWTSDPLGMGALSVNPPRLLGYPVFTTNQLDVDASDNDETELFFGRWKDVVIGIRKAIEIQTSFERYFDFDQVGIRALLRYDVGMYREEAIQALTNVRLPA